MVTPDLRWLGRQLSVCDRYSSFGVDGNGLGAISTFGLLVLIYNTVTQQKVFRMTLHKNSFCFLTCDQLSSRIIMARVWSKTVYCHGMVIKRLSTIYWVVTTTKHGVHVADLQLFPGPFTISIYGWISTQNCLSLSLSVRKGHPSSKRPVLNEGFQ